MRSARIRAMTSDGPPAENGTTMVIGCDGKFSASALPPAARTASAARTIFRITFSQNTTIVIACDKREAFAQGSTCDEAMLPVPLYGLLPGACHRARIRATRWLAMTVSYSLA